MSESCYMLTVSSETNHKFRFVPTHEIIVFAVHGRCSWGSLYSRRQPGGLPNGNKTLEDQRLVLYCEGCIIDKITSEFGVRGLVKQCVKNCPTDVRTNRKLIKSIIGLQAEIGPNVVPRLPSMTRFGQQVHALRVRRAPALILLTI